MSISRHRTWRLANVYLTAQNLTPCKCYLTAQNLTPCKCLSYGIEPDALQMSILRHRTWRLQNTTPTATLPLSTSCVFIQIWQHIVYAVDKTSSHKLIHGFREAVRFKLVTFHKTQTYPSIAYCKHIKHYWEYRLYYINKSYWLLKQVGRIVTTRLLKVNNYHTR
jgi:hypothetical protein